MLVVSTHGFLEGGYQKAMMKMMAGMKKRLLSVAPTGFQEMAPKSQKDAAQGPKESKKKKKKQKKQEETAFDEDIVKDLVISSDEDEDDKDDERRPAHEDAEEGPVLGKRQTKKRIATSKPSLGKSNVRKRKSKKLKNAN